MADDAPTLRAAISAEPTAGPIDGDALTGRADVDGEAATSRPRYRQRRQSLPLRAAPAKDADAAT